MQENLSLQSSYALSHSHFCNIVTKKKWITGTKITWFVVRCGQNWNQGMEILTINWWNQTKIWLGGVEKLEQESLRRNPETGGKIGNRQLWRKRWTWTQDREGWRRLWVIETKNKDKELLEIKRNKGGFELTFGSLFIGTKSNMQELKHRLARRVWNVCLSNMENCFFG